MEDEARRKKWKGILWHFLLLFIFLLLTCSNIDKPSPGWEEAILVSPSIAIITGHPIPSQFTTIQIAGREWPIMEAPWIGAIESYLILPIFKIFGISLYTLRVTEILLSLLIGLSFGKLCRIMFGERISYIATPLILFDATYLLYGRTGFQGIMLVLWGSCAFTLFFFWKWIKSQKIHWLYLSAFIMGLGMYGKLHFFGIVIGIALGWWLFVRRPYRLPLSGSIILRFFLFMGLGFSPYIIENINTHGREITDLIWLFFHPIDGLSNRAYFKHLFVRFVQLGDALMGMGFCRGHRWLGWINMAPVVFLITLLFPSVRERLGEKKSSLSFLLVCILSFMLVVAFKGTTLGQNHVFPILPLVLISIVVILDVFIRNTALLFISLILLLMPDLFIIARYHLSLPMGHYDEPIVNFSNYLLSQGLHTPIFVNNYRLTPTIAILTRGKIFPIEVKPDKPEAQLIEEYDQWMGDKENIYILAESSFLCGMEEAKKGYEIFKQSLQKNNRNIVVLKEYSTEDTSLSVCKLE